MTLDRPSTASPFGNIALCLSGGGYRAATYALGTIDMLQLVELLDDVKLMSTVSGGTFTGVTYALAVADSKTYSDYYNQLYTFLRDTNCVELALDDLYKTPSPSGRKDLSLIRSAAKVYDTRLFGKPGRTFADLQGLVGEGKRFLELIHNSTEFRKGNSFRFRASQNPNVFAGNGDFNVAKEIAAEIRLADVVASSSCFPGAFEPMRFPDDFVWSGGIVAIRQELLKDLNRGRLSIPSGFEGANGECISLPLMDGGIYDNQGISNAVEADRTVEDPKVAIIDLFLICDTSARNEDMLRYPKPDLRRGWLSLGSLFWMAAALFLFAVISEIFLVYYLATAVDTRSLTWMRFIFQYLSPIGLFVVLIVILIWGYGLFRKNKEIVVSGAKFKLWPVVRRLTLPDLIDMVKARITSLGTMAGDVFMKRVRQLQFIDVMSSDRGPKVSFDLIYEMNPTNKDRTDLYKLDPELQPNERMKALSACAEQVPTTLWFPKAGEENIRVDTMTEKCTADHPDQQRLLLACGQCTTCFCLIKHLWRRWQRQSKVNPATPKPNDPASPYFDIYTRLHEIWLRLQADPYCLVDRPRKSV